MGWWMDGVWVALPVAWNRGVWEGIYQRKAGVQIAFDLASGMLET